MTAFKKCDYCYSPRSDVKKYKSGYIDKFGKSGHSVMVNSARLKQEKVVFWLCDMCIDFLVPKEHRHRNVISNTFLEQPSEIWEIAKRSVSQGQNSGLNIPSLRDKYK